MTLMIQDRLDLVAPTPAAAQAPLDLLTACHRRIEERLDLLPKIAQAAQSGDRARLAQIPDAVRFVLGYFQSGLQRHVADEDLDFFPLVRRADAELDAVVLQLEADHRAFEFVHNELDSVLAQIAMTPRPDLARRLTEVATYLTPLYRRHLGVEEAQVFSKARDLLSQAQIAALGEKFRKRRGL